MSRSAKQQRAEQILGELAELAHMLAKDLAADVRASEDREEKALLMQAFDRTCRTVRLTLALNFKLDRDAAREAREAEREAAALAADAAAREAQIAKATAAANLGPARVTPEENQKRRVRGVLNRLLWTEAEGDSEDYDVLLEDLDARLYEAEDAPGFADIPIEVLAETLARDMRLSGELIVTTAETIAPHLRSGGGGPRPVEGVVEGANTSSQPPLADTG
jgi:hypothetical protein